MRGISTLFDWLQDFHLVRPLWCLAILPCAWLLYRFALYQRSTSGWASAIDEELLSVQLAPGTATKRHGTTILLGIVMALAIIALAGPAWQRLPQAVEQKRDALVIVVDMSLSMYAQDIAPSRLVRARQKIVDILRLRDEGFTALVAYAGDAHAVSPLTDDTRTIENLVTALSPNMMPLPGSRPGAGIETALTLLENAGIQDARILLVTDGIDQIGDVTRHSNRRIPISILGVGTDAGANIPLDFANQPGRVLQDEEGDLILARLDESRLAEIAELSHGHFSTLTLDEKDIGKILPTLDLGEESSLSDRQFDSWADAGPYLVLLLIPFVLVTFRRGALAVLLICFVVPSADAGLWDDLWQRRDQQAHDALTHGAPEEAAVLFADPDWKAAAHYRMGEFERAENRFKTDDSADGHYNRGNALAQSGQLDAAIEAYDKTLEIEPEHEDALFNKELLEQAKENQQGESSDKDNQESQEDSEQDSEQDRSEQSEGDSSDSEQEESDESEQSETDEGEEGEEQEQEEQSAQEQAEDNEETEAAQEEAQEATDEQKAAMEQWLRRVPDDPGGLLRRKFKYETDKRRREGDYTKPRKIW